MMMGAAVTNDRSQITTAQGAYQPSPQRRESGGAKKELIKQLNMIRGGNKAPSTTTGPRTPIGSSIGSSSIFAKRPRTDWENDKNSTKEQIWSPAGKMRCNFGALCERNSADHFEDYAHPRRDRSAGVVQQKPRQQFQPRQQGEGGFKNLGNTCYMNSTFQMLANVEPLVRKMASHPPAASVLDPATELAKSARNLFFSLKRAHEPVAPHEFLNSLRTSFPQFAQRGENGGWAQQDAEECLTQIMQVLSSKVKEDGKSVVEDLFGIEMDIEVKATEGDEPAYTEKEKVLKMACHIEGPVMQPDGSNKGGTDLLPQCIAKAMVSQLEKTSPVLGRQVIYNKTAKITKLPPYLLCQFVRFYWKQDTQKKAKILRPVKFPVTLDMKDYCTDPLKASIEEWREVELKKQEAEKLAKRFKNFGGDEAAPAAAGAAGGEAAKAGEAMEVEGAAAAGAPAAGAGAAAPAAPAAAAGNVEDKWGSYELTGVLTHQGRSADGGHYISWIKKEGASKEASQTWYKFDDDKVSEVDEKKVKELYGGGDWHMAYICLYKKCDTVFGSDSTRY
eukprot:CAMPEP_0180230834 /NCGR_PEP_ID=MMETSP0987-20121128/26410_1 /TAXON_ID=697907 /ORGANISM="non described non described, Strain CCMP2293" /LENGTH=559 /DNA_ID=CAMNT_0022195925 /DNA_START=12 /DNA_END=1691 /DNA_ORIENTATION=+